MGTIYSDIASAPKASLALALIALISIPSAVYARSQSDRLVRMPEVADLKNSQTMSLLEAPLNINPIGQGGPELAIVDRTALAAEGEESGAFMDASKSGGQISVYVVREGDTLSGIAKMFDVSTNTLVWANNIQGGKIKPGQELIILPISGVRHTVKSGDTLKSIAAKYKADIEDVLAYNDLESNSKIIAGSVVIVPNGVVSATSSGSTPARTAVTSRTSVSASVGYFLRPINGGKKSQGIHGYNAVDIAAPIGTPIYAAADGKVIVSRKSGYNGGYGTYVVISHSNGTQTLYAHMSRNNVSVGQTVGKGETIGAVGNTGRSTGPHIHFEIRGAKNPF